MGEKDKAQSQFGRVPGVISIALWRSFPSRPFKGATTHPRPPWPESSKRTWDTALAAEEGKIIAQLQEEVREVLDERFLQLSIEVLTLKTHEVFLDAGENCVQRNLAVIIKWSNL